MKNFLTWMILALVSLGAYAQNQTIRGTVLSKTDGEPLIGATVIPVNNPSSGTATDIEGSRGRQPEGVVCRLHSRSCAC